jgi:hypothetical protein
MKPIHVAGACVATVAIGAAIVGVSAGRSSLYGLLPASSEASATSNPQSLSALLAAETAVLTRKGISPARASLAISAQTQIAQKKLVATIEGALGDSYGGGWFDPATATLHVGVLSTADRRTVERIAAQANLAARVAATTVRSTWGQLQAAQQRWDRRLASLLTSGRAQTALAPQANALLITLSPAVPAAQRAALERDAASGPVNIQVAVAQRPLVGLVRESTATSCNVFEPTKAANCNPTLTSGVLIESAGGEICSAGPLAIPKGTKLETYVITAGHCIKELSSGRGGIGSKWFAFNRARTKGEIGPASEFFENTKDDVGTIRIARPGFWSLNTTTPVFADTAEWTKTNEQSFPVEGERAPMTGNVDCHEGRTTGQACGVITKTSVGTEGFVEVGGGAASAGGDSGGPWMFITTKADLSVLMEGSHVGKEGTNPIFEALSKSFNALSGLNLELLTILNECRPFPSTGALWVVNGRDLAPCESASLNSLPTVDSSPILDFRVAGVPFAILCGAVHLINGRISPPNIGSIEKIDFLNCHTISPTPTACQLTGGQTTLTLIVTPALLYLQKSATRALIKPATGKLLAEIPFKEGTACALEGEQPAKGEVVLSTPTEGEERATQGLAALGSEENNSLELGSGIKAFLLGKLLVSLTSGQSWAFK